MRHLRIISITAAFALAVLGATPSSGASPNALRVTNFVLQDSQPFGTAGTHCTVTFGVDWAPVQRKQLYVALVGATGQDYAAVLRPANEGSAQLVYSTRALASTEDLHVDLRAWNVHKGGASRTIHSTIPFSLTYSSDCSSYNFVPA